MPRCRYCRKECTDPAELKRADGGVTVCNACGGYEYCPQCNNLWENVFAEEGAPCFACQEKRATDMENHCDVR